MSLTRLSDAVLEWLDGQDDPRAHHLATDLRARQCACGVPRETCPEHKPEVIS